MQMQVHFKGGYTTKTLLVAPKDKHNIRKESAVIYRYRYDRLECGEE